MDLENEVFKVYNPLFPNQMVEASSELIQDFKAITTPGHYDGSEAWYTLLSNFLREEYREKYGA